jgi:hypothetical protein
VFGITPTHLPILPTSKCFELQLIVLPHKCLKIYNFFSITTFLIDSNASKTYLSSSSANIIKSPSNVFIYLFNNGCPYLPSGPFKFLI